MKFIVSVFAIFFTLGICSGTIEHQNSEYIGKSNNHRNGERQYINQAEGQYKKLSESNTNTLVQDLENEINEYNNNIKSSFESAVHSIAKFGEKFNDFITDKFAAIYQRLEGQLKHDFLSMNKLPKFTDPLPIQFTNSKFASLANATFKDVVLRGMSNFNKSKLEINNEQKTAVLTLYAKEMLVSGEYQTYSFFNTYSGNFHINLYDEVIFTETYNYEVQESTINIVYSSGKFKYGKIDSTYENLGLLTKIFQSTLSSIVMEWIENNVETEINRYIKSSVVLRINDYVFSSSGKSNDQFWEAELKNIQTEMHNKLREGNYSAIEYHEDQPENIKHKNYVAKILSVFLSGLDKFNLKFNGMQNETNKVTIKVVLSVESFKGATTLSVKNTQNGGTFQPVLVPFMGKEMQADVDVLVQQLENPAKISTSVKMNVGNLLIQVPTTQLQLIQDLIRNHLAYALKNSIVKNMGKLIETEIQNILLRGKMYSMSKNKM